MTSSLTETHIPAVHALIAAAGHGSRAGGDLPKQYQAVAGVAMVVRTLMAFDAVLRLKTLSVVISEGDTLFPALPKMAHPVNKRLVGGATRAHSVLNGLKSLRQSGAADADWVMVHDAARCLILPEQIDALIDACLTAGEGGLIAQPLPDTLKLQAKSAGSPRAELPRAESTIDRAEKWLAQTPQMFPLGELIAALDDALGNSLGNAPDTVTDESSAMERAGRKPLLVKGSAQNFKVTFPEDFALAGAIIQLRESTKENLR